MELITYNLIIPIGSGSTCVGFQLCPANDGINAYVLSADPSKCSHKVQVG